MGGGIGCARDGGASNGINGMPPESYNIAKILGNEVCLKILGTCTPFRQWMGGKSGKLPSRYFFPVQIFCSNVASLGAHTYLSWWRQPNSQIQIPINCTEKKIKSSKQQARLLQALHVEAIQPSDKVKLLELLVKMKFAQDHCYDLAELAVELWRLEIVAWIFQCGLSSNSYVILDPKKL